MKGSISQGNDVYSLGCYNETEAPCFLNMSCDPTKCELCSSILDKSLLLLNMPESNILRLRSVPPLTNIPKFTTGKEIADFHVDDINIGFGTVNLFSEMVRDHLFSIDENKDLIEHFLQQDNIALKNIEYYFKKYNFDEVYMFNGRFPRVWTILQYCIKNHIDYYITEAGSSKYKYNLVKNASLHELKDIKDEMTEYWSQGSVDKEDIGKKWFEDKKNSVAQGWESLFTNNQKHGKLPQFFDKGKENIAIFNSSLDEYYFFDDLRNPIDEDENKIILKLMDIFKDDLSKHFYLRMHPNLSNKNSAQYKELLNLSKEGYKNLTIIFPHETISTYALMENCDKVLVFMSTMGVESAFWGKPTILAGRSLYEDMDCVYMAKTLENLVKLLNERLEPKNQNNTLPYGYWRSVFGVEFKYYKPFDLSRGEFLGLDLRFDEVDTNIPTSFSNKLKKISRKVARHVREIKIVKYISKIRNNFRRKFK